MSSSLPASPASSATSPRSPYGPLSLDSTNCTVRTAVRMRPASIGEQSDQMPQMIFMNRETNCVEVVASTNAGSKLPNKKYNFDHMFDPDARQEEVYSKIGRPLVQCVMYGINCSLFAYGQTGTGKTHSIVGKNGMTSAAESDFGIIPRLGRDVLDAAEYGPSFSEDSLDKYCISVSLIEIYNEKVFDLLCVPLHGHRVAPSRIREHPQEGAFVENLTKVPILTYDNYCRIVESGLNRRKIGETLMNLESSRSHTIFTIYVTRSTSKSSAEWEQSAKISLVDLAGSETVAKSGLSPMRVKEASYINKSLSTLCDVIQTLSKKSSIALGTDSKVEFVQYRNSILTWLLKEMISGNCVTTILATIGPSAATIRESERTLRYVQRAKMITNTIHVNEKYSAKKTQEMVELLAAMKTITEKFDRLVNDSKQLNPSTSIRHELTETVNTIVKRVDEMEIRTNSPALSRDDVCQSHGNAVSEIRRTKSFNSAISPGTGGRPPKHTLKRPQPVQTNSIYIDWGVACEIRSHDDKASNDRESAVTISPSTVLTTRGHQRSISQPGDSTPFGLLSPPSRRRSTSSGSTSSIKSHSNVVMAAIDLRSRRAESIRRAQQGTKSKSGLSPKSQTPGIGSNNSAGKISICDTLAQQPGMEEMCCSYDDDDDISDLHSLESYMAKNDSAVNSPGVRTVDDLILEYEKIINELQIVLSEAGLQQYDDMSTSRSFLTSTSLDVDHFDSYSFNSVGRGTPTSSPVPDGNPEQSLSVQQLQQMLLEKDAQIEILNGQLAESHIKFNIMQRKAQQDVDSAHRRLEALQISKTEEIERLKRDIKLIRVRSDILLTTPSPASSEIRQSPDLDRDSDYVFSFDEYDVDYATSNHSLALRLSIAAAKEKEAQANAAVDLTATTPRLAMESIETPRNETDDMLVRQRIETSDLKSTLKQCMSDSEMGLLPDQIWVDIEVMMSYVNRIMRDILTSGQTKVFSDVKGILENAKNCDVLKTFEVIRPLIAQQFKSIVESGEEIVSIWSTLEHFMKGDYEKVDILQDLIVAKLRLAELESELTTVRGQKMVKQENPAVLSDFIPSIFKIIS